MVSLRQNTNTDLPALLEGCKQGLRQSQQRLYEQFYGYAMNVCMRYGNDYVSAVEIVNHGFLKVFTKLETYNPNRSFRAWVRRIMINSAVDHYRKEFKHRFNHNDIDMYDQISNWENAIDKISYQDLIKQIQRLPPSYRVVFNLYIIEGYKHEEIGKMLDISTGTSKSNLFRARIQLRDALRKIYMNEVA